MRLMFSFEEKTRLFRLCSCHAIASSQSGYDTYFNSEFATGSIHSEGRVARAAVEARNSIAQTFEIRPEFVTFTGGGMSK